MRYFCLLVSIFILSACSQGAVLLSSAHQDFQQPQETAVPEVVIVSIGPTPTSIRTLATAPNTERAFENGRPLIARVNNEPILLDEYNKQVSALEQTLIAQGIDLQDKSSQKLLSDTYTDVLAGLIDQQIIAQQAVDLNLSISEEAVETKRQEIEAEIADSGQFERWLVDNQMDEQIFMANLRTQLTASRVYEYVTQHVPESAAQIRLQYIHTNDQATATAIRQQLEEGTPFATLVQQQSEQRGNSAVASLDWIPQQTKLIPAPVEAVAFSLQPQEMAGPIKTSSGFYVIKVEEKETDRPLTEDMRQILKRQLFDTWLQERRATTAVEHFTDVH